MEAVMGVKSSSHFCKVAGSVGKTEKFSERFVAEFSRSRKIAVNGFVSY